MTQKKIKTWGPQLDGKWIAHTKAKEEFSYRHWLVKPKLEEFLTDFAKRYKSERINILDFGCGNGFFTIKVLSKFFKNSASNITLHGIDISKKLLEEFIINSKDNFSSNWCPKIPLDFSKKIYKENELEGIWGHNRVKYDLILSIFTMHNIENFTNVFENLKNLLNKNGEFFFVVVHPEFASWLNGKEAFEKDSIIYQKDNTKDHSFVGNYPIPRVDKENKMPFYVPYYHRNMEQWQKLFSQCHIEFIGLKPSTKEELQAFKKNYRDSVYEPGIYDINSGLCIKGKFRDELLDTEISFDECIQYFENKYSSQVTPKRYLQEKIYQREMLKITSQNYEQSSFINELTELNEKLGEKIYIIKKGQIAAGRLHKDKIDKKDDVYFIPEFIFGPGDILGDYEASFGRLIPNSSNTLPLQHFFQSLLSLKKVSSLFCIAYSDELREVLLPNLIKSMITPKSIKSIREAIKACQINNAESFFNKIKEIYNQIKINVSFSGNIEILEICPNDFIRILQDDEVVKNWYIKQNILKTKRMRIITKDLALSSKSKSSNENEINQLKCNNEFKILLSILLNFYFFQGIGEKEDKKHVIKIIFTKRMHLIDPDADKNDLNKSLLNFSLFSNMISDCSYLPNSYNQKFIEELKKLKIDLKIVKSKNNKGIPSILEIAFDPSEIDFQDIFDRLTRVEKPLYTN